VAARGGRGKKRKRRGAETTGPATETASLQREKEEDENPGGGIDQMLNELRAAARVDTVEPPTRRFRPKLVSRRV
jgi:hypothetical protein